MESPLSWPTEDVAQATRKDIVRWWESRRLRFNFYVGAVGLVTWFLVLIAGSAAVKPGVDFEEPIAMVFGPFIYAFTENICYTLGRVVDTIAFRRAPRTSVYKAGVTFLVILNALPGVLGCGCMVDDPNYRAQTRLVTCLKLPL